MPRYRVITQSKNTDIRAPRDDRSRSASIVTASSLAGAAGLVDDTTRVVAIEELADEITVSREEITALVRQGIDEESYGLAEMDDAPLVDLDTENHLSLIEGLAGLLDSHGIVPGITTDEIRDGDGILEDAVRLGFLDYATGAWISVNVDIRGIICEGSGWGGVVDVAENLIDVANRNHLV